MKEAFHIFSYYGAKNRLATKYPAPQHDIVIEPFAGSAAYSCRHFKRQVVLYDKDPVVCGVLDYVIKADPAEIMKLPLLYEGESVKDLTIPQEAQWLIGFWLNTCGASPANKRSVWGRAGLATSKSGVWGLKVRAMVAYASKHIKHWRVYNKSWDQLDVNRRGDACWFVDPPYQEMGKYYRCPAKDIDFPKLGQWCRELPGQVIVCENRGADWLPFQTFGTEQGQRMNGKMEVVWYKNCRKAGFGLI